ncbi:MAG TPA: tyrosinase family protein [Actinomycetota bacterium]|jgi:tyrosinase|nr:tyrosinase family protein [Actinomycetota bacterium]
MRSRSRIAGTVAALAILATAMVGHASGSEGPRIRKDVTSLSTAERGDFVRAVLALKRAPSPFDEGLSYYDQFVKWHVQLSICEAGDPSAGRRQWGHGGPVFLPWHRQFLLMFEDALRDVSGKNLTVPYWDWTDHSSVRRVFADDFMGGDGDPLADFSVTTGPFRAEKWKLTVHNSGAGYGLMKTSSLTRHFGSWPASELPTEADVRSAFSAPRYDVPPYNTASDPAQSFRNALEGNNPVAEARWAACLPDGRTTPSASPGKFTLHNVVHVWVGGVITPNADGPRLLGTMTVPLASPNDPVFFLHHANIDRLWAEWQDAHGLNTYEPRTGYPLNNRDDVMQPFDTHGIRVTPGSVDDYRGLGYRYDTSARQSPSRGRVSSALPSAYGWSCVL